MKKYILIVIMVCSAYTLGAQGHVDALRYSRLTPGGTARSLGMGGAFGALGGDFSTASINPAGIGLYRKAELTFTPELYKSTIKSTYYGSEYSENETSINFNNIGYVAVYDETPGALKSFNFAIGFNKLANFSGKSFAGGVNPLTSYADYIASQANNDGLNSITEMFYNAWVIDDNGEGGYLINDDYLFNVGEGEDLRTQQDISTTTKGKVNEWLVTGSFNISNKLFLGATLSALPVYFEMDRMVSEFDARDMSRDYFDYSESLRVNGIGYSAKIGAIFMPFKFLRLGGAIHTPVTYNLNETYKTYINSAYVDETIYPKDEQNEKIDYYENNYTVKTPRKVVLSAGLILGKILAVDADLERVDYSTMSIWNEYIDRKEEGEIINDIYGSAFNFRLGGELRLGSYYFRGGYNFYGSPYQSGEINEHNYTQSLATGFGFRSKDFFFDLAYVYSFRDDVEHFYYFNDSVIESDNNIKYDVSTGKLMATFGFRF